MTSEVDPDAADDERLVEAALRPRRLEEFVGQERVREQLELVLESAKRRGRPPDHVLLSGAPGLGKTSLAMIIAAELGTGIRVTSGPALERAGDLAALVSARPARMRPSPSAGASTACATAMPRTCSKPASICTACSNGWATNTSAPPCATCTWRARMRPRARGVNRSSC